MIQGDGNTGPVYRGIVGIDVEGLNRPDWTDPIRRQLRNRPYQVVDQAVAHAQLTTAQVAHHDEGDGLWLLVTPEFSTARLLHPLASHPASRRATNGPRISDLSTAASIPSA